MIRIVIIRKQRLKGCSARSKARRSLGFLVLIRIRILMSDPGINPGIFGITVLRVLPIEDKNQNTLQILYVKVILTILTF